MPDPSNSQFPNPPKSPDDGIVGPPKRRKGLYWSNDGTNLDVENPAPIGGPIHITDDNHQHKYTPDNTYLDNFQGAQSPK